MKENNHVIVGTTAVLYNVALSQFFNGNGSLKNEFSTGLHDIGFRIKPSASGTWLSYSIRKGFDGTDFDNDISNISDIADNEVPSSRYRLKRFDIYKEHIYPCRVLYKNLERGVSYDIESYYVKNGNIYSFNSQTFQTLAQTDTCSYNELSWDTSKPVPQDKRQEVQELITEALDEMCEIYNMFCPVNYSFTPVIYWDDTIRTTASSDMRYNGYNCIKYGVKSTAVHEMAHNHLNSGNFWGRTDKIIRFMEFATSVEDSYSVWVGGHNFPIISGAIFDYMDNCLVAAACWVSKQNV